MKHLRTMAATALLLSCDPGHIPTDEPIECALPWYGELCFDRNLPEPDKYVKIMSSPCPPGSEERILGGLPYIQKVCFGEGYLIEVASYHHGFGYSFTVEGDGSLVRCNPREQVDGIYPLALQIEGPVQAYRHLLAPEDHSCLEDGACELISQMWGLEPCIR